MSCISGFEWLQAFAPFFHTNLRCLRNIADPVDWRRYKRMCTDWKLLSKSDQTSPVIWLFQDYGRLHRIANECGSVIADQNRIRLQQIYSVQHFFTHSTYCTADIKTQGAQVTESVSKVLLWIVCVHQSVQCVFLFLQELPLPLVTLNRNSVKSNKKKRTKLAYKTINFHRKTEREEEIKLFIWIVMLCHVSVK